MNNIIRICSMNALFLRQAQVKDAEDIKNILSHIQKLIKAQSDNIYQKVPMEYLCPISFELMTDPFLLSTSGDSYQKDAIEKYLKKYSKDPKTQKQATVSDLTQNRILKELIQKWQKENQRKS